jgi:hypothetical protein
VLEYLPETNPCLCKVDQKIVLRPSSCGVDLLQRKIRPVLLEMNMNDKGNSLDYRLDPVSLVPSLHQNRVLVNTYDCPPAYLVAPMHLPVFQQRLARCHQ